MKGTSCIQKVTELIKKRVLEFNSPFDSPIEESQYLNEQKELSLLRSKGYCMIIIFTCTARFTTTFFNKTENDTKHCIILSCLLIGICFGLALGFRIIPSQLAILRKETEEIISKQKSTTEFIANYLVASFIYTTTVIITLRINIEASDDYLRGISITFTTVLAIYNAVFLFRRKDFSLFFLILYGVFYEILVPSSSISQRIDGTTKVWVSIAVGYSFCSAYQQEQRYQFTLRKKLSDQERFYHSFVDSMPFPIIFGSKIKGVIFQNNASKLAPFSFNPSNFSQKAEELLNYNKQSLRDCLDEAHDKIYNCQGSISEKICENEFNSTSKESKKKLRFNITLFATNFFEGEHAIALLFNDVSAQKELEEERVAEKYKNMLICSFSHEMRTPINILIGTLKKTKEIFKESQECSLLCSASAYAHVLSVKLNDMIDMAMLQFGDFVLHFEPTSIFSLAKKLIKWMSFEVASKPVKLKMVVDPLLKTPCLYDCNRIMQILLNLLSNGIKFTKIGFVELAVCIEGNMLKFSVQDTGIGMHPDQLCSLFQSHQKKEEIFKEAVPKKSVGLCGLGLTISQQIATKMNTEIFVKSEVGVGSIFWFYLPYNNGSYLDTQFKIVDQPLSSRRSESVELISPFSIKADKDDFIGVENNAKRIPRMSFHNMTLGNEEEEKKEKKSVVLIIDDTEMNRLVLRWMIEKHNLNIVIYEGKTGIEAVKLFRMYVRGRNISCLIYMDIEMPEMDGIEATRIIRKESNYNDVCIVAATAFASEIERNTCLEVGMNAFFTKPITSSQIRHSLKLSNLLP